MPQFIAALFRNIENNQQHQLWFRIPAGWTRERARAHFAGLPPGFAEPGFEFVNVGSPSGVLAEGATLQPDLPGLDFGDRGTTGTGGLERESAQAAFQQFLPTIDPTFTPTGQLTRARRAAEAQFDPFFSAAGVQIPLTRRPGEQPIGTEFETFLGQQGGIDPRSALRQALGTARGTTTANQVMPFDALDPALEIINPQNAFEGQSLANLALSARQAGIAPIFRNRFSRPTADDVFGRFAAGRAAAGGGGPSYVEFLTNLLGLNRIGFGAGA